MKWGNKNPQSQLHIKVPEIFYTNGGTPEFIVGNKNTFADRQKMPPIEQPYNREKKVLHGHNLQREHDTGGTPVAAY